MSSLQAVLFDLDGTLLDTAPDMVAALNRLRAEEGLAAMEYHVLRAQVSHGSARLVQAGFADRSPAARLALQQRFLTGYRAHLSEHTRLFEGMAEVLHELRSSRMQLGVVTNKPGWLTAPLLASLGLDAMLDCVVSGDTVEFCKPHPQPMLHAAELIKARAPQCIYVGDAERDVQAAHAAGMPAIVALYGYIDAREDTGRWNAEGSVLAPLDIVPWLRAHSYL